MTSKKFDKNEFRKIAVNGKLKDMIIYLNNHPPGIGLSGEYSNRLKLRLNNLNLRILGKKRIKEAYELANPKSYWRKVLKEKLDLIEEGKILKFRIRKFRRIMNFEEMIEYLNEHPPGWLQWRRYVKGKVKLMIANSANIDKLIELANKNYRHGKFLHSFKEEN